MKAAPAALRNRDAILNGLKIYLNNEGKIMNGLEVSSGWGTHVSYIAQHLPWIRWQPSEYERDCFRYTVWPDWSQNHEILCPNIEWFVIGEIFAKNQVFFGQKLSLWSFWGCQKSQILLKSPGCWCPLETKSNGLLWSLWLWHFCASQKPLKSFLIWMLMCCCDKI